MEYQAILNQEKKYDIAFTAEKIFVHQKEFTGDIVALSQDKFQVIYQNKTYFVSIEQYDELQKTVQISVNGKTQLVPLKSGLDKLLEKMGMSNYGAQKSNHVKAPMPGKVLGILVKPGEVVKKGTALLVLEAMKMENVLKADQEALVEKIAVSEGQTVEKNTLLIQLAAV